MGERLLIIMKMLMGKRRGVGRETVYNRLFMRLSIEPRELRMKRRRVGRRWELIGEQGILYRASYAHAACISSTECIEYSYCILPYDGDAGLVVVDMCRRGGRV
jgi:hypothetical protein